MTSYYQISTGTLELHQPKIDLSSGIPQLMGLPLIVLIKVLPLTYSWCRGMWLEGIFSGFAMAEEIGKDLVSKAKFIAESLYRECIDKDGGVRLRQTGALSPAGTLKSHSARFAFDWASHIPMERKFFTKAACRLAIQNLLSMPNVEVPRLPGMPLELWIEQQAKTVQHLCQRSRKNRGSSMRFPAYRQLSMDWTDTMPMQARKIQCDVRSLDCIEKGKIDVMGFVSNPVQTFFYTTSSEPQSNLFTILSGRGCQVVSRILEAGPNRESRYSFFCPMVHRLYIYPFNSHSRSFLDGLPKNNK